MAEEQDDGEGMDIDGGVSEYGDEDGDDSGGYDEGEDDEEAEEEEGGEGMQPAGGYLNQFTMLLGDALGAGSEANDPPNTRSAGCEAQQLPGSFLAELTGALDEPTTGTSVVDVAKPIAGPVAEPPVAGAFAMDPGMLAELQSQLLQQLGQLPVLPGGDVCAGDAQVQVQPTATVVPLQHSAPLNAANMNLGMLPSEVGKPGAMRLHDLQAPPTSAPGACM